MRALLSRSSSWRERAKIQVGRQKALDSRTKVQVIQPEKPLQELVYKSTVKDTLYFTLFGFDKWVPLPYCSPADEISRLL
jgi:hypothetical protein